MTNIMSRETLKNLLVQWTHENFVLKSKCPKGTISSTTTCFNEVPMLETFLEEFSSIWVALKSSSEG